MEISGPYPSECTRVLCRGRPWTERFLRHRRLFRRRQESKLVWFLGGQGYGGPGVASVFPFLRYEMIFDDFLFEPIISVTAMEIMKRDVGKSIAARRKKEGGLTQVMADSLIESAVSERAISFNDLLAPFANHSVHRALKKGTKNRNHFSQTQ